VIYLMASSISQTNASSNCMTFVTNEFQGVWKRKTVTQFEVPYQNLTKTSWKTPRIFSVKYPFPLPVFHPICPPNEAGLLFTRPRYFIRTVHQSVMSHFIRCVIAAESNILHTYMIPAAYVSWLLGWRVLISLRAWMFVSCVCCLLCR
jgi:hypothetical protein